MRIRIPLGPNEIQAGRVRHRHRFDVCASEYLNSNRQTTLSFYFAADRRHRRNDLRSNFTFEIRDVVHILNNHAIDTALPVNPRLLFRLTYQLHDTLCPARRPRQRANMNYPDDGFKAREKGRHEIE